MHKNKKKPNKTEERFRYVWYAYPDKSEKSQQALVGAGARVALTTHYTQLKELAARDDRFAVSAMQFVDGRPTYRLVKGAVGESFALQVRRLYTSKMK